MRMCMCEMCFGVVIYHTVIIKFVFALLVTAFYKMLHP